MVTARYDPVARTLHWTVVVLLFVTMPMGILMYSVLGRGALQDALFTVHKSLGLLILALMLARLGWRLAHGAPPPSPALRPLEIAASRGVHWLLYLLLLLMPVTGYVMETAGGFAVSFFGLVAVPRLVAPDKALSDMAERAHLTLQWAIYALVLMHVGAALHHHFFRRNDVLARMWPGLRSRA